MGGRTLRFAASTRSLLAFAAKQLLCFLQHFPQLLDFFQRVVEIEAGSIAGCYSQSLMQWHGAMMAGSNGHAVSVKDLSDVVSMDTVDDETDDSGLLSTARVQGSERRPPFP